MKSITKVNKYSWINRTSISYPGYLLQLKPMKIKFVEVKDEYKEYITEIEILVI